MDLYQAMTRSFFAKMLKMCVPEVHMALARAVPQLHGLHRRRFHSHQALVFQARHNGRMSSARRTAHAPALVQVGM